MSSPKLRIAVTGGGSDPGKRTKVAVHIASMKQLKSFLLGLILAGCTQRGPSATHVTAPQISYEDVRDAFASTEWMTYGHDYSNDRYSPLAQIDKSALSRLAPAYIFQTDENGPLEATPIESRGILYLSGSHDAVYALDARTGRVIWRYLPQLQPSKVCCGPVNRGVALSNGVVVIGQLDGRLVALDQFTGAIVWTVQVTPSTSGGSITMAPLIYKDAVLVGVAGGEFGVRGSMTSYSLDDGRLNWRWYSTDPAHWAGGFVVKTSEGELLHQRDPPVERKTYRHYSNAWLRGGGAVWMTPAIDSTRDTVYLATGNPWPERGQQRPGDNLYTDSVVALNASTGRLRWFYQEVPHDIWDWDAASPPFLLQTQDRRGKLVDAVAEAGKTGWLYVLDRDTGTLIRRSRNFVPQMNMFGAPTDRGLIVAPGGGGGSNWSPVSFNPDLHIAVVVASHHPKILYSDPRIGGFFRNKHAHMPHYGLVSGIDVDTGAILWQDRSSEGLVGGSLSTASGLTFLGESNGHFDAVDTKTGAFLWSFEAGAGVNAAPMTFALGDEQYVAVCAGGNTQLGTRYGDSLVVFHIVR